MSSYFTYTLSTVFKTYVITVFLPIFMSARKPLLTLCIKLIISVALIYATSLIFVCTFGTKSAICRGANPEYPAENSYYKNYLDIASGNIIRELAMIIPMLILFALVCVPVLLRRKE